MLRSHDDEVSRVFPRRKNNLFGGVTVSDHFRNLATPPHLLRHPIADALVNFLHLHFFVIRRVDHPESGTEGGGKFRRTFQALLREACEIDGAEYVLNIG